MTARDVIKTALTSTQNLLNWYLSDLSDADLAVRPVPTANTIAWQLGHLINAEVGLLKDLPGARYPELPGAFKEQYTNKTSQIAPAGGYMKKAEYVDWFNKVRAASLENVDRLGPATIALHGRGHAAKNTPR